MIQNDKILVLPGCGGKTTLSQKYKNYIDIDKFWDINGETEIQMTKEFNKAKENNNKELVKKLIKDCMNYKATKIKNNLNQKDVIILVQSVEQANIISNNKNNIFCFVPSIELHELSMEKRKDSDFVKDICRKQRKDIIESGWKYFSYNDFQELERLINKQIDSS